MKAFKHRENGSIGLAALLAIAALAAATMYVKSTSENLKMAMGAAKLTRSSESYNQGALNALSRFRALSAPKQIGSNRYVPQIYSTNYYSKNWNLVDRSTRQRVSTISIPRFELNDRAIVRIMNGASTTQLKKVFYDVKVVDTKANPKNPRVIDFVEVEVSLGAEGRKIRANVPVMAPQPTSAQIWFRKKGQTFARLESGQELSGSDYEFEVRASGVVFDASVMLNGKEVRRVGGLDPSTNQISHAATSYAAADVPLSPPFEMNLTEGEVPPDTASPAQPQPEPPGLVFDNASCKFKEKPSKGITKGSKTSGGGSELVIEAVVFGPDLRMRRSSGALKVRMKGASPKSDGLDPITLLVTDDEKSKANYAKTCSRECPQIDDTSGADGVVAANGRRIFSGGVSMMYAVGLNIKNQKVCIDYSTYKPGNELSITLVAFDPRTCKKTVLFAPNKWPGCEISL